MALIKCPKCDGTVSTKASACPHCGAAPIVQLTEEERFQKLVDDLGSVSAARSAMEDGVDPLNSPPANTASNNAPKSNTMPAAAWVAVIIILVRLWMYADRVWTNHSDAVEAEKLRQQGEQVTKYVEDISAKIREQQRAEDLRKKLNPDIHDLMKVPGSHVEQQNNPSR